MRFNLIWGPHDTEQVVDEFAVGRREGDVTFPSDEIMSGKHARFYVLDGQLHVMDMGSSNGTRVNRKKIKSHTPIVLSHNDEVKIGSRIFRVQFEEEPTFERTRLEPITGDGTFVEMPGEKTYVEGSQTPVAEAEVSREPSITNLPPASSTVSISADDIPKPRQLKRYLQDDRDLDSEPAFVERAQEKLRWVWSQKPLVAGLAILFIIITIHLVVAKFGPEKLAKAQVAQAARTVDSAPDAPAIIREEIKPLEVARPVDTEPAPAEKKFIVAEISQPTTAEAAPAEAAPVSVSDTILPPPAPVRAVKKAASKKNKKDRFQEARLLGQLAQLSSEYKRTQSSRVRAAIETDAVELSTQHYHGLRLEIKKKWDGGRNLASAQKSQLKETLTRALVEVNNREKAVRVRILDFIMGRRKTPFP